MGARPGRIVPIPWRSVGGFERPPLTGGSRHPSRAETPLEHSPSVVARNKSFLAAVSAATPIFMADFAQRPRAAARGVHSGDNLRPRASATEAKLEETAISTSSLPSTCFNPRAFDVPSIDTGADAYAPDSKVRVGLAAAT